MPEIGILRAVEHMLRSELELLRAGKDEERKTKEFILA